MGVSLMTIKQDASQESVERSTSSGLSECVPHGDGLPGLVRHLCPVAPLRGRLRRAHAAPANYQAAAAARHHANLEGV